MEVVRWKDGLCSAYKVVEEVPGQRLLIEDVPETGKHVVLLRQQFGCIHASLSAEIRI